MNTETKLVMLGLISVSILAAIIVLSVSSLVIAFATKKHCNKSDGTCDIKSSEDGTATQDESNNDSNIIDEDSDLDGYQTSTSSITSQDGDRFSLVGV